MCVIDPSVPEVCLGVRHSCVCVCVCLCRLKLQQHFGDPWSSGRLYGWPGDNASHLEAASPASELSDGWGELSRMSS